MEITKWSERSWGSAPQEEVLEEGEILWVLAEGKEWHTGKELCYFLSVGHQHLLLTTSFYFLWVSVHFNKQEFICRLGVWLGSQVSFLFKGAVCVPYNIVFKLLKFYVGFPFHFKPSGLEGGRGNISSFIWKVIARGKHWLWERKRSKHSSWSHSKCKWEENLGSS